jgi:endogenous inhibitor of DNA gyrase (YacG/DUF329 family)
VKTVLHNGIAARCVDARRDAPVECAACGRMVPRAARQQRYCSDRCRDFARREKDASQINGRTAIKNHVVGEDTGQPTNPHKLSNGFNALQAAKAGSTRVICGPQRVIQRELIAGRAWHEEVSPNGVVVQVARFRKATGVTS